MNNIEKFTMNFDRTSKEILDPIREIIWEGEESCQRENLIAHIMMENLFPHDLDPERTSYADPFKGKLTTEQKIVLTRIASHMGPDWVQALYHAAVFMTKVA